jgi:pimeloyl-ACP methyl ester carboxylesterase
MHMYTSLFSLALPGGLGLAAAAGPANTSEGCDPQCQGRITLTASWEAQQHAPTDFSFYQIPSNFSSKLKPGSLLRVEAATNLANYTVPSGLTMSRIIYTTTDLHEKVLPASAYILWPYIQPNKSPIRGEKSGYPMVAWAHGTSGLFRACAPSNYRNLQYHFMAPFMFALQGIAVVAPDYAGLGFKTLPSGEAIRHPWLTGPAQANDLANAITAARTAFPGLLSPDGDFVAVGHSQGGAATWAFAERLVSNPMSGYKGTVSIAPPVRLIQHLENTLANTSQPFSNLVLGAQPKIVAAVTAVFPKYNYSGMSSMAYGRWRDGIEPAEGCLPTDSLLFADISNNTMKLAQLGRSGWTKDETVRQYLDLSKTGGNKFEGPLLVIAGNADAIVPQYSIKAAVDETCSRLTRERWSESLELVTYKNVGHFPVLQASQLQWLDWVKDRLSGKTAQSNTGCTTKLVEGFGSEFTPSAQAPNFLVQWASSMEMWKYTL